MQDGALSPAPCWPVHPLQPLPWRCSWAQQHPACCDAREPTTLPWAQGSLNPGTRSRADGEAAALCFRSLLFGFHGDGVLVPRAEEASGGM